MNTVNTVLVADPTCASAIDTARAALVAEVPDADVGDHLEAVAEADLIVTHLFESAKPGYRGWRWAVTVARAPGSDEVTVDELVLLPGPDAIVSREWIPWHDRVEPGDLAPGDILPTAKDDPRVVAGFSGEGEADDDDQLDPRLWELGLGRVRVLSEAGRTLAASRWAAGDGGPDSAFAKWSNEQCSTCAFLLVMAGPLSQSFGVCGNEYSQSDGRVVAMDHGCGAHSEVPAPAPVVETSDLVIDDSRLETLNLEAD